MTLEQALERAIELGRTPEQPVAERLERVGLEHEVVADLAVEELDRLHRQVEPLPLPLAGRLQVGIGPGHPGVGQREIVVGPL